MQRTPDTVRSIDDCTTAFKPRCLVQSSSENEQRGVHFEPDREDRDGSASGKLQFHVFAALAEFERSPIRERTQAGWQQPAPWPGGRKPKLDDQQVRDQSPVARSRY